MTPPQTLGQYAWLCEHGAELKVARASFDKTINDVEITAKMAKNLMAEYNRLLGVLYRHWSIVRGEGKSTPIELEMNEKPGLASQPDETGVDDEFNEWARGDEGALIVIEGISIETARMWQQSEYDEESDHSDVDSPFSSEGS